MVLLLVALALLAPALARAAATTPATTTGVAGITPTTTTPPSTTTAPPTTTGAQGTAAASSSSSDDKRWIAVAVLLFGLAVIWLLLQYLEWEQGRYFRQLRWLTQRGRRVTTTDVTPLTRMSMLDAAGNEQLSITGPDRMAVGDEQPFTAERGDAKVTAKWAATPDGLTLTPDEGDTVTAKAAKAGEYQVTATAGQNSVTRTVTVEDAGGSSLPFVGAGYGTLVLAVVLVVAATVLGLLGAFNSAVATLFGAIAGYIFVKGASSDSGGSSGGSSSGTAK